MTKFLKKAAAITLFAGALFAQRTAPDPATIVANQVAHLTALLDLTTAQATQATSIFTTAITATTTLETTLDTDQTNLQTAVKANNTATITQLAAAIGTLDGQILAIRSTAKAAFYAILTSTQQSKLTSLNGLGFGGPGGGHGGPGFGPHP